MKFLLLILACWAISSDAVAETSVPDVVRTFRAINVTYSAGAKDCNLHHSPAYTERLSEKLAAMGVTQSDDSILFANLGVSGKRFGLMGGRCVTLVELVFATNLSKDNIVTDNQNVRDAVDRLGSFPIVLYENGRFSVQPQEQPAGGGKSTTSMKAALEMIDQLVARFADKRK